MHYWGRSVIKSCQTIYLHTHLRHELQPNQFRFLRSFKKTPFDKTGQGDFFDSDEMGIHLS
ncbi:hypothetical protein Lgee_0722 [Legionella geestiana]|uniref:Uncharacterized protein n=1 Tax=Legionella geestiana TaxID=45065 RepID=A0A0W0U4H0_9GAMM|nr:hypothetical protein Lgee_0722 [Legionella geestiana]STX53139.1 Uncharacterised protein [Legionella geestiana]